MFKKSTHVDSFQMRICGIHIQAIEKGALIKLLNIAKDKEKKKIFEYIIHDKTIWRIH